MQLIKRNKQAVYAFAEEALPAIPLAQTKTSPLYTEGEKLVIRPPGLAEVPLDLKTWLPFASTQYHISPAVEDYVLVPVIIMPSDIPNRNGVGFPLRQLVRFNPELGVQAYKTWKGKPTHYEHRNEDITKAYGVIADSYLTKMSGWSHDRVWKLLLLLAFDRTKYSDIVSRIDSGDLNSYSMGAWVDSYECSYCGRPVAHNSGCTHLDPDAKHLQFYELNGKLVFKNVVNPIGFETSAVENPAYVSAISDTRLQYS